MPNIDANGASIYYELTGNGGDPMVLIHGSWGDHRNWSLVVPGLSKDFRVLTFDRRGHSASGKVATQGSADEDGDDVVALLTELELSPAHVVGNSFGAIIALKLAARKPAVFRSLMVHEPPLFGVLADDPAFGPMMAEGRKRADAVIKMLEDGDSEGGARQFVETLMVGPGGWDKMPPAMKATFTNNADTWLDETRNLSDINVDLSALSKFDRPAKVSYGGKSPPFFKPIAEKVAGAIPGSRLEVYPDDGHTPHITNPGEFVRRAAAFSAASG